MGETTKLVFHFLVVSCSAFIIDGVALGRVPQTPYWDTLVLTQFWPPAACLLMESEHKECNMSADLTSWMIHGLWPTKSGTEEPNFCNNSWPFDPKILQVLQPRLGQNWPSITKDEHPDELWHHEWDKHGTCGTSLPALRDELHYFNMTLDQHDRFNLSQFFKKSGITPSEDEAYKASDLTKALRDRVGSSPVLTCVKDWTNGKCYLEQVELCLTKSFQPTDCVPPHDLVFKSETAISGRRESDDFCDCSSEKIYYKPVPSVKLPPHM